LPYKPKEKVPVWNMVGKFMSQDLTKVPLPVELNEPLSML
jgi:hypothetical protein